MTEDPHQVKVLVMDGDPRLRQGLAKQLEDLGLDVVAIAMSARTAQPKIESYRPTAVAVDLATAKADGMALLDWLHTEMPDIVVVGSVAVEAGRTLSDQARALGSIIVQRPQAVDESGILVFARDIAARIPRAGAQPKTRRMESRPNPPPQATPAEPIRAQQAHPQIPAASPVSRKEAVVPVQATQRREPVEFPAIAAAVESRTRPERKRRKPVQVVAIGISTGGPKALNELMPRLPADFPVPIVIVQHMPPMFTASLAESLDKVSPLHIVEGAAGQLLQAGQVLIAPGGKHMRVARVDGKVQIRITEDPPEHSCRPAVDYLLRSLDEVFDGAVCAVIMTGMGEDGLAGSRQLYANGATIVAQDKESCTVFGMPRGLVESGIADVVSPLDELADRITEAVRGSVRCS